MILVRVPSKVEVKFKGENLDTFFNKNSLNICLVQEIEKFNKLLNVILSSLDELTKAIKGENVMSAILDSMYKSMYNN